MIVPGITVQADPNDIPTGLLQPAELISLSGYPDAVVAEMQHPDLELQHDLLVDVIVDANGQMTTYNIIAGIGFTRRSSSARSDADLLSLPSDAELRSSHCRRPRSPQL